MDDSSRGAAADRKSTPLASKSEAGRVTGSPRLGQTHQRAIFDSASDFAIFTPEDHVHDAFERSALSQRSFVAAEGS
jgi:hypothetical protein